MRPSGRTTRVAAVVTVPALVVTLAVLDRGFPLARLDLDDGGVWVTATDRGLVGRYNVPVEELNAGLAAGAARFDVAQDGADVLLVTPTAVAVVDPASVATVAEVATAGMTASMAAGTAAFADDDGGVWVRPLGGLDELRLGQDPPDVAAGPGGRAVVASSGDALAVSAADGAVTRVTAQGAQSAGSVGPGEVEQLTAVGDEPVVLAGSTLRTRRGSAHLPGGGLVLQQPGPASSVVLVASRTALLEVSLDGGRVVEHATGGAGPPARPVRVGTCAYGAWAAGTGSYLQLCDGAAEVRRDLDQAGSAGELVFRVNRSLVVLNDTAAGRLWLPTQDSDVRVPDWEQVAPQPQEQPDTEQAQGELTADLVSECGQDSGTPVARDDDLGVRPGRTTLLPVLDNDSSSDCGILAITEFDQPPASFGTIEAVYGGRELQVRVPATAHGSAQVTYTIGDGRGTSAPSTATLTLRVADGASNGAPAQVRVPTATVDAGGRVTAEVLSSFADPDGDDLQLVAATADPAYGTVRSRQDGSLTFQADGGSLGQVRVELQVSDGTQVATGYLSVDVRAEGSVAPRIDPVFAVTYVDRPVTVRPLDFVRTSSAEPVALAGVDDVVGATVVADLVGGTFTFTAPRSGTYYVPFLVTAPPQQASGLARIDVREWPDQALPPVAVRDRALLPAGGQVTIDPLANDEDPSGAVLVLQSVEVPDGYGLHVAVLGHHLVQITSDRALDGPVVVPYTVSNGAADAVGEIVVIPVPASGSSQAPVVDNVEVTVRTGGVVTVPVLDSAYDPDGDELTLVRDLPEPLGAGQGLLFVSGDVLRYQAPATPMTVRATFAVADSAGNTTAATLTVRVHASDPDSKAPPQPRDLVARVYAGDTVRIDVPLVGIDADGDGVTLLGLASAPGKGVVTVGPDWLSYEAFGDDSGTDTFTYAVEDWTGQRAVATVRVGIAPRPTSAATVVARDDAVTVRPGERVEVRVLANDVDSAGGTLTLDPALEVPDGVEASADVERGRVGVTAPATPGTVQVVYTATNARGGRDSAVLTVTVAADAPVLPPVARDVVVPASDTFGKTEVAVDVLGVAQNPSGPLSDLAVSVPESSADVATVAPDGTVVVTLADRAQTLPYLLTNTREPSAFAYAFITVPALGNFPPTLRRNAPELTIASGATLVIPLDEHVQVAPGRTPSIADETQVTATRSNGALLVRDSRTVQFTSADGYSGPASVTVPVTDATGPDDPLARTALLTLPITVVAVDDHPPTFAPSQVRVAPGEAPVAVDLLAFLTGPDGRAAQADDYTFRLTSPVPRGFVASLAGSVLSVSAGATTAKGTTGSLDLAIGYGRAGVLDVSVDLAVTASTRQRAKVADQRIGDGVQGRDTTIAVLQGAYNPFPDSPLTVVGVAVDTAGAGGATYSASAVTLRPAADFVGELVVRFRVRDVTGDPDREVEGRLTLVVSGVPAAPAPPRVGQVGDGKVDLSWTAPDSRGQPVDQYRVTAMPGMLVRACPSTACTIDGLTNDVEYTFAVEAHNAVGWSAVSGPSAPARPDAVPDPPGDVRLAFGDRTLTASWTAPPLTGSPVTSYAVELTGGAGGPVTVTETSTSHTFSGLTNGTRYTVRVRARNRAPDPSAWSASVSEVPAGVPAAPVPEASRRQGAVTGNVVDVSWADVVGAAANGDPVIRYEVSVDSGEPVSAGQATSYQIREAQRRTYEIRVRAVNKAGASAWGAVTGEVWSAPGVPTGLVAAASTAATTPEPAWGDGWVRLSWNAPADTGGADATITGYEVEGAGTSTTVTGTSTTFAGLPGGQAQTFSVRALSSKGAASDWVAVTSGTVVTAPAPPAVAVTAGPDVDCVAIAVTAGSNGGAAVTATQYRINGGEWTAIADAAAVPSPYCTPGTQTAVQVEVRVQNAPGGTWSTGSGSATTKPPTNPDPPSITAVQWRWSQLRVVADPPAATGGRGLDLYQWQFTAGAGSTDPLQTGDVAVDTPGQRFELSVSPPAGAGDVQVRVRNSAGLWSAWSVQNLPQH
jgi:hypothetical protein